MTTLSFERISPRAHRLAMRGPGGWPIAMLAIELGPKARAGERPELLIYSPTWCGEGTFEAVEAIGTPAIFVAPNHHHHLSLARFRERWPGTPALTSETALPRLKELGHAELEAVTSNQVLAGDVRAIPCEGTKAGELWFSFPELCDDGASETTLVCCDAFFHVLRGMDWPASWIMRGLRSYGELSLGRTFAWLALGDAPAYTRWATDFLGGLAPTRLLLSHGDVIEDRALATRLSTLIRECL